MRDALSSTRYRSSDREIIDGRGSIDSRAFSERDELVGYTIDERDQHDPRLDTNMSKSRWKSHAGQGFGKANGKFRPTRRNAASPYADLGSASREPFLPGVPMIVKIIVPVVIVLAIILIFILTH